MSTWSCWIAFLLECREKVARIEDAFATELKKPVTDRSAPLLFYLDKSAPPTPSGWTC